MRYLKPSLLYRQLRPALGPRADFASFVKVKNLVASDVQCLVRTQLGSVRPYCEKVERPKGMDNKPPKTGVAKKAVGPISWFNLGASCVIGGIVMAFYYYARYTGIFI